MTKNDMNTALLQYGNETSNSSLRRVLRMSVNLAFRDSMRLRARSLDVSPNAMTMMSPLQIASGSICDIDFNVPLDGRFPLVRAVSKCTASICVGTQGFRTSLKFIEIDSSSMQILGDLMRYRF
ncbi:MAG: PilZ protein [Burkholderiaceae bacterium]|nr:PilZ protein [Burkholderiaceae bacterium]